MKVLGVCCSGRLHGNTEIMLKEALESAKDAGAGVELVTLAGKNITPCDGCWTCQETGRCHSEDDLQDVLTKMKEADGIIFGTPVYVGSVTGQAKVLLDRSCSLTRGGRPLYALRGKVGGVVVTTARVGATSAISVFNGFFRQIMINAGAAVGLTGGISEDKVKGKAPRDSVRSDKLGMREARDLGRAVVRRIEEASLVKKYAAPSE